MEAIFRGIKFSDSDVVNLDDCNWEDEYNPHNVHPWLLHDHGFVLAIVFASTLQDALDEAVDADKLDHLQVSEKELQADYDGDIDSLASLGNAGELFDIQSVGYFELPCPKLSFCGLFQLSEEDAS